MSKETIFHGRSEVPKVLQKSNCSIYVPALDVSPGSRSSASVQQEVQITLLLCLLKAFKVCKKSVCAKCAVGKRVGGTAD